MSRRAADTRSAARLAAVQALYELEVSGAPVDDVMLEFLGDRWADAASIEAATESGGAPAPMVAPDRELFVRLVRGVAGRRADLDRIVGAALTAEWSVARLDAVLRAILRAGAFELLELAEVPARTVIDEYVDLANAFFDGAEPKLVNGVLDRIARTLRSGELSAGG